MGAQGSAPRTLVVDNERSDCEGVVTVPVTAAVSRAVSSGLNDNEGSSSREAEHGRSSYAEERMHRRQAVYEERIRSLELKNASLLQEKLRIFADVITRVEEKYLQVTRPVVCADVQAAVVKCYAEHRTETLRCAAQVRAFNECTRHYHKLVGAQ